MRLLGLDVETTGLDWKKERILEIGISLHEANDPVHLDQRTWLIKDEEIEERLPLSPEITRLTGIKGEALSEFGIHPTTVYRELDQYCVDHRVDFLVGHNCHNFDRPFIFHELDRLKLEVPLLRKTPWIDTRRDIPYPAGEEPRIRSLEHLLMKKRFIPAVSHRALADAAHTMWLLSHYNFSEVLEYWKIPWKVVRLMVSYEDRDIAKEGGFFWQELNYKIYPKQWVKLIKETELAGEQKKYPSHELIVIE